MQRGVHYLPLIALLVGLASIPLRAQEDATNERTRISATAVVVRGMAASAATFIDFDIRRFTTDEERAELFPNGRDAVLQITLPESDRGGSRIHKREASEP